MDEMNGPVIGLSRFIPSIKENGARDSRFPPSGVSAGGGPGPPESEGAAAAETQAKAGCCGPGREMILRRLASLQLPLGCV